MDAVHFIGRFHPLIVHLPIGFLLLALIMQLALRVERFKMLQPAMPFVLFWAMISAVGAACMGYMLSLEGGYETSTLNWHQWTGILLALSTIGLYYSYTKQWKSKLPLLGLSGFLLLLCGHFGGVLTHGSQYLSEYAPTPLQSLFGKNSNDSTLVVDNVSNAGIYTHIIQPILQKKCISCHNENKTKGGLLMDTKEGIEAGGKHGPLIQAGTPFQSALIHRIVLPESDKKHMPPIGKPQISTEELSLLQWWIAEGSNFEQTISDQKLPAPIQAIIQTRIKSADQLLAEQVSPISSKQFKQIQEADIPIYRLGNQSPLVEVDLSYQQNLSTSSLKPLKKAAEQLVQLDLSHSNITDDLLSFVKQFPNLRKLSLHHTTISDNGLEHLKACKNLKDLNLYATQVSDAGLQTLSSHPSLRQVFLWQTNVSPEGSAQFVKQNSSIKVNIGLEHDTTFSSVQLKAPLITADKDLFLDTLNVDLELNFGKATIYFTLDGSTPTHQSQQYEAPFTIDSTTLVKAIATREGWSPSEVVERQFVRVRHQPRTIQLQSKPNERYAANGAQSLMDLRKGSDQFTDGLWLGWEGQDVVATIDLGAVKEVSRVTVSALENVQSWIFSPRGIDIWTSKTGANFQKVATSRYPAPSEPTDPSTKIYSERFEQKAARYIRLKVKSQLKNPNWHPAPGGSSWVFLDEILVE